jgi:hypothetical protein
MLLTHYYVIKLKNNKLKIKSNYLEISKIFSLLGVAAHVYNPCYSGDRSGGLQPREKVHETLS